MLWDVANQMVQEQLKTDEAVAREMQSNFLEEQISPEAQVEENEWQQARRTVKPKSVTTADCSFSGSPIFGDNSFKSLADGELNVSNLAASSPGASESSFSFADPPKAAKERKDPYVPKGNPKSNLEAVHACKVSLSTPSFPTEK